MIRLLTSDGVNAPEPLLDVDDGDWEILQDVVDADAAEDMHADGSPASWLIDAETIEFLRWNALSPQTVQALRSRLRPDGFVEVVWEEV